MVLSVPGEAEAVGAVSSHLHRLCSSPSPSPTFTPGQCVLCSDVFIVMGCPETKEFNLSEPSEVVGMLLEIAVLSNPFGKR